MPRWRYAFIVSYSRDPDKLAIPAIRALYSQLCPIMSQYHHTILVKGWTGKLELLDNVLILFGDAMRLILENYKRVMIE